MVGVLQSPLELVCPQTGGRLFYEVIQAVDFYGLLLYLVELLLLCVEPETLF